VLPEGRIPFGFKDGLHNPHVEGSVELDLQFGEVEGYPGIRRPDIEDYEKK
jgi:hypothetical protein